jgi:hypothetical protein
MAAAARTERGDQQHLRAVGRVHDKDRADGKARVLNPDVPDRRYPSGPTDWAWRGHSRFPSRRRADAACGRVVRLHVVVFGDARRGLGAPTPGMLRDALQGDAPYVRRTAT